MATMEPFYSPLFHLCTRTVVFFELLFFQVVVLIRCVLPGTIVVSSGKLSRIITAQYLNLVEEKNPTVRFRGESKQQGSSMECAVCLSEVLEGDRVRRLSGGCKHTFHKDCLDRWLLHMATCPLCRTKVLPDEVVANYQQLHNQIMNGAGGGYDDIIVLLSALFGDSLHRFF